MTTRGAQMLAALALLVRARDGRVLTVARRGHPRDVGLPGGKCEPGESVVEAAVRELREETTIVARAQSCHELWRSNGGDPGWTVAVVLVDAWEGEPESPPGEGAVAWALPWELLGDRCRYRGYYEKLFSSTGLSTEPAEDRVVVREAAWGAAVVWRPAPGGAWIGCVTSAHGAIVDAKNGFSLPGSAAAWAVDELEARGPAIMIGT